MDETDIIARVNSLTQEYLEQNGIELVEMVYRREQGGMVLRILADTAGGITINECEELNNFLNAELDKENIIEERYTIEVSSPGLDRPIKTDRDFERAVDKGIEVTTYIPIDGKKSHEGRLIGINKDEIVVESDGVSTIVPRAKIALARRRIEI